MDKIGSALKSGFGGLLRFSGRSSRTDFWIHAILIFMMIILVWITVMGIEMARTFGEVQQYAAENPDKVTVTTGPNSYSVKINDGAPGVGPDFNYLVKWLSVITLAAIALLSAAAFRRLHDINWRGSWFFLPFPLLFSGLWLMSSVIGDFSSVAAPNMGLFGLLFINNAVYLMTVGFLVFLLLRPGTEGENRFGRRDFEDGI